MATIVVAEFTLVQAKDAILGPVPTFSTWVLVLTISLPLASESFGLIVVITSTLGVCGFKIGFVLL